MNIFYVLAITITVLVCAQRICDKLDEIREPMMCVKSEKK